ncbi:MAG TPA: hypothetical protein VGI20_13310 [Rhizomicrobium sp.]|jgi:hypothetical protein
MATKAASTIIVSRVQTGEPLQFQVLVRETSGETSHTVTMSRPTCEKLAGGERTPEQVIEAAFRFLLDREPKESILSRFDVTEISRYFPEFPRELQHYLPRA